MKSDREKFILKSRVALLQRKGWAYLRYLHMRNAMQMMKDCETLLFVGAGYGFAEVVLAAEYPDRRFILTDVPGNTYGFTRVREWMVRGQVMNVELGALDIMDVGRQRGVDAVIAVEVLEYVRNPRTAARNMLDLSSKATFCLAPFVVANPVTAPRVSEGRVTAGFDKKSMRGLFGERAQVRWGYWADAGVALRKELDKRGPERIKADAPRLLALADKDIRETPAASPKVAQVIKALVRK